MLRSKHNDTKKSFLNLLKFIKDLHHDYLKFVSLKV